MTGTPSIKVNLAANIAGKAWGAAMNIAFVPLYIHFLGIEAYGLVGMYTVLVITFSVLDLGLSTTINRALAQLSSDATGAQEARDLTRTLESVYWGIGLVIGICIVILAPFIARSWVRVEGLSLDVITQALMLMGLAAVLQWPASLYMGGLMGLQRQVLLNSILGITATLHGVGALLVLSLISPTIQAFFLWQALIYLVESCALAGCLWRVMPDHPARPCVRWDLWRAHGAFAISMTGISLLSIILTQLDKAILSTLLPLTVFGYYTLANVVANSLTYITNPIFSAFFPRLSQFVAAQSHADLAVLYHKGCQLMALALVPVGLTLCLFAPELLTLWVRDPLIVANTQQLVRLLAIGTLLNGLMTLPFAVQLAYGWTRLLISQNIVAVCVLAPLLLVMVERFGSTGAAVVWMVLNSCYVLLGIPLMHRRLLVGEQAHWYLVDVLLPIGVGLAVALPLRLLLPVGASTIIVIVWIGATAALMLSAITAALPVSRSWLNQHITGSRMWRREQVKR